MVNRFQTRIIFVDGPTGVGKDYFISNLTKELDERFPTLTYEVIRATDVVLDQDTQSENRKYIPYATLESQSNSIFAGHVRLLALINDKLFNTKDPVDVIVVNRSFLSFMIYNIYPNEPLCGPGRDAFKAYLREIFTYLDTYAKLFTSLFRKTPSLLVNLTVEGETVDSKLELVVNRLQARQDGKLIDQTWLKYLLIAYNEPDKVFSEAFTHQEKLTSDSFKYVLGKYF